MSTLYAPPWQLIISDRIIQVAKKLGVPFLEDKMLRFFFDGEKNRIHIIGLPLVYRNFFTTDPVVPIILLLRKLSHKMWSRMKDQRDYEKFHERLAKAEASSSPYRCVEAFSFFLKLVKTKEPEDSYLLPLRATSLYGALMDCNSSLGVHTCAGCRRTDMDEEIRIHPLFERDVFLCSVCFMRYAQRKWSEGGSCRCCARGTLLDGKRVDPSALCDVIKCTQCSFYWCDPCLFHLGGGREVERAHYSSVWTCFACREDSPCIKGAKLRDAIENARWTTSFVRSTKRVEDITNALVASCANADRVNASSIVSARSLNRGVVVVSLCTGMGNCITALRQMRVQIDAVYSYEIDVDARRCLRASHRDVNIIHLGDVKTFDIADIRHANVDLLIGGFPCTPFSGQQHLNKHIKVHKDANIYRNFRRILRSIRKHKNKRVQFLFENVVGMPLETRRKISEAFGLKEPLHVPGELFSATSRDRLFWTNIGQRVKDVENELTKPFPPILLSYVLQHPARPTTPFGRCITSSNGAEIWARDGQRVEDVDNRCASNMVLRNVCEPRQGYRNLTPDEAERALGLLPGCTMALASSKTSDNLRRWKVSGAVFLPAAIMFLLRSLRCIFRNAEPSRDYPYRIRLHGRRAWWKPGIGIKFDDEDIVDNCEVAEDTKKNAQPKVEFNHFASLRNSSSWPDFTQKILEENVWCVCNRRNDHDEYIACERGSECLLNGWCHPRCIGLKTIREAREHFECPCCIAKRERRKRKGMVSHWKRVKKMHKSTKSFATTMAQPHVTCTQDPETSISCACKSALDEICTELSVRPMR